MKRCTRCVLPDTVPGITFDDDGVCNYCLSFQQQEPLGQEKLKELVAESGKGDGQYDCIVPLSGGRDSTYVLYLAKKVFDLRTLAVHYDHEFKVPQAIVNARTACERLNVEFISIRSRHDVGRKLVRAGLRCGGRNSCFGLCRACEYGYRSAAFRVAIQHKASMIWWGSSKAEKTSRFKVALPRPTGLRKAATLLNADLYRMVYYSLLQQSEFPVPGNRKSPQAMPKLKNESIREVFVFDYIPWDRRAIKETITEELGWQKPLGRISTWRADCSLHDLLDYAYIQVFGCSKSAFGYCNMINSGDMDREEALLQEEHLITHCKDGLDKLLREDIGLSSEEAAAIL